jgi:hypothetical protein
VTIAITRCAICAELNGFHKISCERYLIDENDSVNSPTHYASHPSGIECIQITEHMGFNLGNVFKYLWRADLKGSPINDLKKAAWYLNREIEKRGASE